MTSPKPSRAIRSPMHRRYSANVAPSLPIGPTPGFSGKPDAYGAQLSPCGLAGMVIADDAMTWVLPKISPKNSRSTVRANLRDGDAAGLC